MGRGRCGYHTLALPSRGTGRLGAAAELPTPSPARTSDRPRWQQAQPCPLLRGHGCIVCRLPTTIPQTPPAFPHPGETGLRRTGGRDNHWSIKSVGRTRPQNILLMEPVSNPSCLVWQPGRGRPTRPLSREPNNPYLTEREVRAQARAQTSQVVRCIQKSMRAAYPQNRHGTQVEIGAPPARLAACAP